MGGMGCQGGRPDAVPTLPNQPAVKGGGEDVMDMFDTKAPSTRSMFDIDTLIQERKRDKYISTGHFLTPQERVSRILPFHYFIHWVIVGQLLFLVHFLLHLVAGSKSDYCLSVAFLCLMIGYWNALVVFMSRKLDAFLDSLKHFVELPESQVEQWYIKRVKRVFSAKAFLGCLLVVGLPIMFGLPVITRFFSAPAPWFHSLPQRYFFMFLWVFFSLLASRHCAISANLVFLMRDISFLPLHLGLDLESSKSVRTIATLFFGFSLHYVVLTSLAFGMILSSPFQLSTPAYICMGISAVFLLFIFLGPQWCVHRAMVADKRERVRKFNGHFENIVKQIEDDPNEEHFQKFDALMRFREKLTQMPEWPFNPQMLLGIVSAIFIPILILVLQLAFGKQ